MSKFDIWKKNGQHCAMLRTRLHSYIEHYLKGETIPIPNPIPSPVMTFDDSQGVILTENHFQELKDYLRKNNLTPFAIEKPVFNKELMIAGTFDKFLSMTRSSIFWLITNDKRN